MVKWNDDARLCRSRPRSSGTGRSARSSRFWPSPGIRTLCTLCPWHGDMRGWLASPARLDWSESGRDGRRPKALTVEVVSNATRARVAIMPRVTVEERHCQSRAWLFQSAASKRSRGRWSGEHCGRSARPRTTAKRKRSVSRHLPTTNTSGVAALPFPLQRWKPIEVEWWSEVNGGRLRGWGVR